MEAQQDSKMLEYFTIKNAKFFDEYEDQLNERPPKVINRILEKSTESLVGEMTIKK